MVDQSDTADNEITRIVRRPGPQKLPLNIVKSPQPSSAAEDASGANAPPISIEAKGPAWAIAPPVVSPAIEDRHRPILTPPPLSAVAPLSLSVPDVNAPVPVALRAVPIAPSVPAPVAKVEPRPIIEPQAADVSGTEPAIVEPVAEQKNPSEPAAGGASESSRQIADQIAVSDIDPVVGWLVVVKGPGRGTSHPIVNGRNSIGSGPSQAIRLDFGDPAIASEGHAYIVYDDEAREFVLEDGKQKIVARLNGKLLTETMPIGSGDTLRIGATALRFVALCGAEFDWNEQGTPSDAVPPADPSNAE